MKISGILLLLLSVSIFGADVDDYHKKMNNAYVDAISQADDKLEKAKAEREKKVRGYVEKYISGLKKVMDGYTKEAKLDKALEVRAKIEEMEKLLAASKPAGPSNAKGLTENDIEKNLGYQLKGHKTGAKIGPNGHWYMLFKETISWMEAAENCKKMGGYLATISDKAENEFVFSITEDLNVWIGGKKNGDKWIWVTGEGMSYTNWYPRHPINQPSLKVFHMNRKNSEVSGGQIAVAVIGPHRAIGGFICEWEK